MPTMSLADAIAQKIRAAEPEPEAGAGAQIKDQELELSSNSGPEPELCHLSGSSEFFPSLTLLPTRFTLPKTMHFKAH